ncbi:hypothetical protein IDH44_23940 [Paenibacillus sp. IB182496]|uniref:Copper amine oxidase-like N-terminal domain-containing protein n=1 Tax=Paenibacillus sabuli TaxID=2772509 RepID=A0A927BZQ4_9BACL|nr:stalk domain-containing protein [Paenibacillus sabuli]MBD2848258.1 hypothetical protein [Paenibacillus sabuli]
MKKKVLVGVMSASLLLNVGIGAFAATNLQEIKAYLNPDLKIKYDGVPVQLKDGNGSVVAPITYNNTTYLPLRSISELVGIGVKFDNTTKTVLLGQSGEGVSIAAEEHDSSHLTRDSAQTTYKGTTYNEAYYNENGGTIILYPETKYTLLKLRFAAIGEGEREIIIKDLDRNTTLKTETVGIEDGMMTIEANISNVDTISVSVSGGGYLIPVSTSTYH